MAVCVYFCDVSCRKEIQGGGLLCGVFIVCVSKSKQIILATTNHTRVSPTHTSARIAHAP